VKKTIHLIGNAHLDPVWFWDRREGLNEGITTVRTMLDLMEEFPEMTFIRGEGHNPSPPGVARSVRNRGRQLAGIQHTSRLVAWGRGRDVELATPERRLEGLPDRTC
jgi:hypothetical protein